jgi:hypothetical protein
MFGRKGVSGKVLTIVISLVIAIVALILLWSFLLKMRPLITKSVENIISGFKKEMCKNIPAWSKLFVKGLLGC